MEPKFLKVIEEGEGAGAGYLVATPKQDGVRRAYLTAVRADAGSRDGFVKASVAHHAWSQNATVFSSEDFARAAYAAAVEQGQGLK